MSAKDSSPNGKKFRLSSGWFLLLAVLAMLYFSPEKVKAQDDMKVEAYDTLNIEKEPIPTTQAGEFSPGRGFDLYKSKWGSLNLSLYGLLRYTNQLPATQSFTDHLGRVRNIDTRHDIQWHRTFVWASGFFYTPKLRYTVSIWGLASTGQTLIFGNMHYQVNKALRLGAGIGPNLGIRSLQGPWPYFMATDRQMAEEALRPGFTGGFWITGEVLPRFSYWLFLGNNLSQLGVNNTQMTRDLTKSFSFWWMPTTGEFGPRGGYGDFEQHQKLATRFGVSFTHAREGRFNPTSEPNPVETQIRLSDGVYLFETGSLADGVTVRNAQYQIGAVDLGFKFKGFHLQTEFFRRRLSHFNTTGPIPESESEIIDNGVYVGASYSVIKKKLDLYGVYSTVIDQFDRNPWEVAGGLSYFPSGTRSWRINLHLIRVERSPAGSTFGYYIAGQSGTTVSIATDIML
ncbi:hypothetical protein F0P94_11490 [Adhaeribacter soli]|uniref:Porin n=2 Tax=Adhaeribacter soli TaxID=2607655 RepID=A0A5N1ISJ1_9BACT|nr:hypothetical protein F0P94_11490 [Adhaeribacter soli]